LVCCLVILFFDLFDQLIDVIVRMTVDQVESPYSPPDSDGTPLGSPTEQRLLSSAGDCSLILPGDIDGKAQAASNHLLDSRASGSSPGHRLVGLSEYF